MAYNIDPAANENNKQMNNYLNECNWIQSNVEDEEPASDTTMYYQHFARCPPITRTTITFYAKPRPFWISNTHIRTLTLTDYGLQI